MSESPAAARGGSRLRLGLGVMAASMALLLPVVVWQDHRTGTALAFLAPLVDGILWLGRRLSEPMLLRIGHAYESATAWHERHPPV